MASTFSTWTFVTCLNMRPVPAGSFFPAVLTRSDANDRHAPEVVLSLAKLNVRMIWRVVLTRLKMPEGIDLHRFFVPECVFSFGNWKIEEVENPRTGDATRWRAVEINEKEIIPPACLLQTRESARKETSRRSGPREPRDRFLLNSATLGSAFVSAPHRQPATVFLQIRLQHEPERVHEHPRG